METIIDKLLSSPDDYEEAKKFSVKTSSEPSEENATTRVFGPYHFDPDLVMDIVCSLDYVDEDLQLSEVDGKTMEEWKEKVRRIAEGHEAFERIAKPAEIALPNGAPLKLQYDKCLGDAEGVGAVYISVGGPKYDIPLFAVRGNPVQREGSFAFNLRAVQAWLGEYVFMNDIKPNKDGKRDFTAWEDDGVPKSNIKKVNKVLLERRRAVDYLVRVANTGPDLAGNKMKIKAEDAMLLLGISYLQRNGVGEIRGIRHEYHPDRENIEDANFNYNKFFAKWAQGRNEDPVHPWTLFRGNPSGYIPHINNLPAGMRTLSIATYTNS